MDDSREKSVCGNCVTDAALRQLVLAQSEGQPCSYCGAKPAAPLDVVIEAVEEAIAWEYEDPANGLPYESAEGGYQGTVYDGDDLVYDMDWTEVEPLLDDVARALCNTAWSQRNYFSLSDYEQLRFGWDNFVEQVRHRTRYLFLEELGTSDPPEMDGIPAGQMLAALGRLFNEHELFKPLPTGTHFIRARITATGEEPCTADELGTAPRDKARSSRMSPAGIPMFYAAFDDDTAILETFDSTHAEGKSINLATFRSLHQLLLLDLTDIPAIPSIFDEETRHNRPALTFLKSFADDLAMPVRRDSLEHVEYVPTQVVTEYVRHRFLTREGNTLAGILYRSSKARAGVAVVLFVEPDQCGPRTRDPLFPTECVLTLDSVRSVAPTEWMHAQGISAPAAGP